MPELQRLLITLKGEMKKKSITYADAAKHLTLSESSIKRLFSSGNISLKRVEQLCSLLSLSLSDLFHNMEENKPKIKHLKHDQEAFIISDTKLLLVTTCVLNHWSFEDIQTYYTLTPAECIEKLSVLDKIKIIEYQPNNRIKLLITSDFSWLPNGPIQTFFQTHLQMDFFKSSFSKNDEVLLCLNGMLSTDNNRKLQQKIEQLATEFSTLNNDTLKSPINELQGSALVIGLRGWKPAIFDAFKR